MTGRMVFRLLEEIEAFNHHDKMKFYIIQYTKAMKTGVIHFIRGYGIINANVSIEDIYQLFVLWVFDNNKAYLH